jgi:hypothetical protein
MEEFGKLTRQAYDTASSLSGAATCPSGKSPDNTVVVTGMRMCFPPCTSAKAGTEAAAACDPNIGNMCISHLGKDYCLESTPIVGDGNTVSLDRKNNIAQLRIVSPSEKPENPTLANWYARLDRFFDSTVAEPMHVVAQEHLGPALNTKIPVPSAFKWIERETYALAQDATTVGHDTNTASGGNTGEVTIEQGELRNETCSNASSSLPTCSPSRNAYNRTDGGSTNSLLGGEHIDKTPVGGEIPSVCREQGSGDGGELPGGTGGTTRNAITQTDASSGGQLNVQCLSYCQANPSLPGCHGVAGVVPTVTAPACPPKGTAEPPALASVCQTCETTNCLELGYCLDGMDCSDAKGDAKFFKQSVRLIL